MPVLESSLDEDALNCARECCRALRVSPFGGLDELQWVRWFVPEDLKDAQIFINQGGL